MESKCKISKNRSLDAFILNWKNYKLGDIVDFYYGYSLPEENRKKGKYPIYGSNGIIGYHNEYKVNGPGIIIGRKGSIGSITWSDTNFWPIDTTYYLKNKNGADLKWLYYKLLSLNLNNFNSATGVPGLNRNDVLSIKILLPSLPEQCKIAAILSTVDEAIEATEKIIKQIKLIKEEVLRIIFKNNLKEYKKMTLNDVTIINKESINPSIEYPNKLFKYIDIDSIENESGNISSVKTFLGKNAPLRARRIIHYNDVIISTVRPYLKAFSIIPMEYDNQLCSTGFAVLTCKEDIYPKYLFYQLFSYYILKQFNKMLVGSNYPALNMKQLSSTKIIVPPLFKQNEIIILLDTINDNIENNIKYKEYLLQLKKGLMQVLLTGKVRVKVDT